MAGEHPKEFLFSHLPDELREALLLTLVEEYSRADLAEIAGVSEETLEAHADEARRLLRERGLDDGAIDAAAQSIINRPLPSLQLPVETGSVAMPAWRYSAARFAGFAACVVLVLTIFFSGYRLVTESEQAAGSSVPGVGKESIALENAPPGRSAVAAGASLSSSDERFRKWSAADYRRLDGPARDDELLGEEIGRQKDRVRAWTGTTDQVGWEKKKG